MNIWTCIFLPFLATFILSAAFALPVSAVCIVKTVASAAAREINV